VPFFPSGISFVRVFVAELMKTELVFAVLIAFITSRSRVSFPVRRDGRSEGRDSPRV
jgi:hypothetical protein